MSNKIFNINFRRLAKLLLPAFLYRQLMPFLDAALKPSETLKQQFDLFREEKERQMSYNSQVCYLRKMLNDRFDNEQRRITIEQSPQVEHLMIYRDEEDRPVMLGTRLLPREDIVLYSSEFTVNIPDSLADREDEIQANINYYKLATRSNIIKRF